MHSKPLKLYDIAHLTKCESSALIDNKNTKMSQMAYGQLNEVNSWHQSVGQVTLLPVATKHLRRKVRVYV